MSSTEGYRCYTQWPLLIFLKSPLVYYKMHLLVCYAYGFLLWKINSIEFLVFILLETPIKYIYIYIYIYIYNFIFFENLVIFERAYESYCKLIWKKLIKIVVINCYCYIAFKLELIIYNGFKTKECMIS
jgi:hypothetical protein